MTLSAWLAWVNGTYIDLDGRYGPQCMDLINSCLVRVWGVPGIGGDAVDVPHTRPTNALWVANSPANYPLAGDIVAWAAGDRYIGTGAYGHTAVAVHAAAHDLVSMDQNWPTGSRSTLVHHSYSGVLGWWHNTSQAFL